MEAKTIPEPVVMKGLAVLKRVLKKLRWDNQHGFPGYRGGGRWNFVSTGLPSVNPDELNALFAAVGVVPDVILPKGACRDCRFAVNGHEQGYRGPCLRCTRPYHSNFKPKARK